MSLLWQEVAVGRAIPRVMVQPTRRLVRLSIQASMGSIEKKPGTSCERSALHLLFTTKLILCSTMHVIKPLREKGNNKRLVFGQLYNY